MSLLSTHLFGQSFQVLKASPCTCSFVASWSFARSLSRDASATWSLNRTLGASKLLCSPGELLQCSIEAVLEIWYPETATRPSAVSAAVVPVFCSTATTIFTFKKTTARVKSRQPDCLSRRCTFCSQLSFYILNHKTRNCRIAKLQSGSSFQSIFTGKRISIWQKGDISASWLLSKSDDLDYELVVKTSFWPIFLGVEKLPPAPALS